MKRKLLVALLLLFTTSQMGLSFAQAQSESSESLSSQEASLESVIEKNNLIDSSNISTTASAKSEQDGDSIILEIVNENGGLQIRAGELETETEYVLGFTYKKLDGNLNSFGGHTDGVWADNIVWVDGKETGEFTDFDSAFVADDENEHYVEIHFTTPQDESPKSSVFIQPNRGDFDEVIVEITDLYIIEAELLNSDETSE